MYLFLNAAEFINPKYADATKTKFKSSSRLECLMQDYPKLLKNCDRVGYTSIDTGFCFSTVKNDLASAIAKWKQGLKSESAGSCEADFYNSNRTMLRLCGANIEEEGAHQVSDMALPLCPMISISPKFAICLTVRVSLRRK
jgi:UDP-sugar pyrophosphorylase